ncbi:MAG: transporter substrate-binding domain-containing protein [Campylobacteraceae bacterium]|nr:transporter substrate-binding domain-containing protein [Campylobacteraceae bacterium]
MKRRNFMLNVLLIMLLSGILQAQTLTIYTEEFPPFNYTNNKQIEGVSTDIVNAIMKKTYFDYTIISIPWARAYKMSQEEPNSLIFSMSRRVKREKLFKWIGIIVPSVHSVFSLKSRDDIEINALDDLKQYQIGTTIEDARETYLVNKGFELSKFQRVAGKSAYLQNYKKLKKERIDVWPMTDAVMNFIVRKAGDEPSKVLKKVYEFSELSTGGYYLAASLSTSDEVVNELKKVLEDFKKTLAYKKILQKWGM